MVHSSRAGSFARSLREMDPLEREEKIRRLRAQAAARSAERAQAQGVLPAERPKAGAATTSRAAVRSTPERSVEEREAKI